MKFGERTFRLSWSKWLLLFACVASMASAANALTQEELDDIFPLPDYVDPEPDDPNDANDCTYQREIYYHTQRWIVDECSRCFCNNGTTNCVYESCPALTCDFFDQVKIEGECCKKCPPEMVVTRVESFLHETDFIIEGKNQELEFDVDVSILKQQTSRNVNGENLWKLSAWISRTFDGSRGRLFLTDNVLSQEQQNIGFSKPDYPPFVFENMTLQLKGARTGLCEDFKYLCVKFNQGDDVMPQFNLPFSFSPQNGDESRLVACSVLPECKAVVIRDFDWSMIESTEENGAAPTIDLDVFFQEDSRDLAGAGLWRASLYGSSNENGFGPKYGEVSQILNREQAGQELLNAQPLEFRDISSDFDFSIVGCIAEASHVCLQISKGRNPLPDYTLQFQNNRGDISDVESSVKCVPRKCGAKAVFSELLPEILSPSALIESTPGQTIELSVNAVSDKELSTNVIGDNLWLMNVFFSQKRSGGGRRIDEQFQILTPQAQRKPLRVNQDLLFSDISFEVDLSTVVCADIPYLCTEMRKNPSASIDYEFGTNPEQIPFVGCLDMSDVCRGIIARNLDWEGEFPNFLNNGAMETVQSIVSNASVDIESVSRNISGRNLWQMSVFASSTAEAAPEDVLTPYFSQVLTEEQSSLPVPEDGILRFYDMATPPFQVDRMGCGKFKFLCYEFKRANDSSVEYTLNERDTGEETLLDCKELQCQAVTPDSLNWTMNAPNSKPGSKTPVTFDVTANFRDDTRDIAGNRLWRLGLFGSNSPIGEGLKFDEVYQLLDNNTVGLPLQNRGPINFGTLPAEFEVGTIGCTEDVNYVCLELTKNANPDPDYVMLIEKDGSFDAKTIVSCHEQECSAKAVFEELNADFPEEAMLVEQRADQPLTVSLNGVTNKEKSTFVSGQNLWEISTYFSPKKTGEGVKIREQTQILDVDERSQELQIGENLEFPEVEFPVDLSGIQCRDIPFMCFELRKGTEASINYKFRPNPATEPLIDCQSTDDLCKGVVARFLTWNPSQDDNGHQPGELSPIIGDVIVDMVPDSRDLSGTSLWQLSTFASSDPEGENKHGPNFKQVLSPTQKKIPLQDGGPLVFNDVITPPYPIDQLGCGNTKYLCFELRRSERSDPEYTFETIDGKNALRQCIEQECEAVYVENLNWTISNPPDPIPGERSPVDLGIDVSFDPLSLRVDGDSLWQVALFGSMSPEGSGARFGEVSQILDEGESSQPIREDFKVEFPNAAALFDIGSIGCTEATHVCIEFKKAQNSSVNFTMIIPSTGDELPESSAISCYPRRCDARVDFVELQPTILEPELLLEDKNDQVFNVDFKAITDKATTTQVAGNDLWQLKSFFSEQPDGVGERIQEKTQILDDFQTSQYLLRGENLIINSTNFEVDLGDKICSDIPYMCFELMKNPRSDIKYEFEDPVLKCIDLSERCKGVVFTDMSFEETLPRVIKPFDLQPLAIDTDLTLEPYSHAVTGDDLWRLKVYTSSDKEGLDPVDTFSDQLLDTRLPPGGPLNLPSITTNDTDILALGCGDGKHLCVSFDRSDNPEPRYTFQVEPDGPPLIRCKELECEGIDITFALAALFTRSVIQYLMGAMSND